MQCGHPVFNVLEGLVDHHILKVHVVRQGVSNHEIYEVGFLVFGAAPLVVGVLLGRAGHGRPPIAGTTTVGDEPEDPRASGDPRVSSSAPPVSSRA